MQWSFGDLLAEATRNRPLRAGTLVGAGMPVLGKPVVLEAGDSLRIEFKLGDGPGPFGAIDMDLAESEQASSLAADADADIDAADADADATTPAEGDDPAEPAATAAADTPEGDIDEPASP